MLPALAITLLGGALFAQQSPLVDRPAPDLSGSQWLNAPDPSSLRLAARRGKVTIVHFWTFACINCRRNLPIYNRWWDRYSSKDVAIVGVHTPELDHEKDWKNVAAETAKLGIRYPVLFDPGYANWTRWSQQYWPTVYAIDKRGVVRGAWIGELNHGGQDGEKKFGALIDRLLAE
jgi:thiol-disulfide isomerase/thioredoxin